MEANSGSGLVPVVEVIPRSGLVPVLGANPRSRLVPMNEANAWSGRVPGCRLLRGHGESRAWFASNSETLSTIMQTNLPEDFGEQVPIFKQK